MNMNLRKHSPVLEPNAPDGRHAPSPPASAPTVLTAPALPMSLTELILAHVPHDAPQPQPTYLFALMVVPPSVVPLAFQSVFRRANVSCERRDLPEHMQVVDPLLSSYRLGSPFSEFDRMFDLALPVLKLAASRSQVLHSKGDLADGVVHGMCRFGNVLGLKKCLAAQLIETTARALVKYLAAASEGGFVSVLDWWFNSVSQVASLNRLPAAVSGWPDCFRAACRSGRCQVMDWWVAYLRPVYPNVRLLITPSSLYWREICQAGHADLLSYVHLELHCDFKADSSVSDCFMDLASRNGHVHVLDWWARSGLPLKFTPAGKIEAAQAGHRHIVEWWNCLPLYRSLRCGTLLAGNPTYAAHTDDPVTLGSFGCLEWISTLGGVGPSQADTMHLGKEFSQAVTRFGHVNVMHAYQLALFQGDTSLEDALKVAAAHNQVPMWRYLVEVLYEGYDQEPDLSALWLDCALIAAEHDSIDIVDILMINHKTRPKPRDMHRLVLASSKGGAERVLHYLIDNGHWTASALTLVQNVDALKSAASHGQSSVLSWWYQHTPKHPAVLLPMSHQLIGSLIGLGASHGHVGVLQWALATFGPKIVAVSASDLQLVGIKQHRRMMEWFLDVGSKKHVECSQAVAQYFELLLKGI